MVPLAIEVFPLHLQRRAIGAFLERVPWVEGIIGVAHRDDESFVVKRDAVRRVHIRVGRDQRRLGVEDQAIEVENERADHGRGMTND